MRIRAMRPGELPRVRAIYDARAKVSVGLLRRDISSWRRRRRKATRNLWIVAEERAALVGYAIGAAEGGWGLVDEVVCLPGRDDVAAPLVDEMLRRVRRRGAGLITVLGMPGSPMLLHARRVASVRPLPPAGVFMAAVTDARSLLRDARRVVAARTACTIRLRVGRMSVATGKGRALVTATMDAHVLLGLLLGLRRLRADLRHGAVRCTPNTTDAREALRAAFPDRTFWILDQW